MSNYIKQLMRGDDLRFVSFYDYPEILTAAKEEITHLHQQIEALREELARYTAAEANDPKAWAGVEMLKTQIMILIEQYGGIDGDHHKAWVLDQIARKIKGDAYDSWVVSMKDGEEGPDTYLYNKGIAP